MLRQPKSFSLIHIRRDLVEFLQEGHPVERKLFAAGMMMIFVLIGLPAFAVLGGSEASVQTDQIQLKASLRSTQVQNYTVHELRAATGTVIREYAAGGTVF